MLVTVRQNRYSVAVALAGRRVLARVGAREITIVTDGRVVARHERLAERFAVSARLDHYLDCCGASRVGWPGRWRCTKSASAALAQLL